MSMYKDLVSSFENEPRDVCTVPLRKKEPLWFYVYSNDGNLFVEVAKYHTNSSSIKKCRLLKEIECDKMMDIYHRRKRGEAVSKEAVATTRNQIYWYGVFSDLGL